MYLWNFAFQQSLSPQKALAAVFTVPFAVLSVSCAERSDPAAPQSVQALKLTSELTGRLASLQGWVSRCKGSVAKENCDVGDALLFEGILCLSGELESCAAVQSSQGLDGRMWRARSRVGKDEINSFSRDMSLGVLAYLVATKDTRLATHWMNWIETHDGKTCDVATDNRCGFTPGFWSLFGDVWSYLGLTKTSSMENDFINDQLTLPLQVSVAPSGYPLHLLGVNLLIRKSMNTQSASVSTAALLLATRQPENPFFQFLNGASSPLLQAQILEKCPAQKPEFADQWSFERASDERAWLSSMGWECVALIRLLKTQGIR